MQKLRGTTGTAASGSANVDMSFPFFGFCLIGVQNVPLALLHAVPPFRPDPLNPFDPFDPCRAEGARLVPPYASPPAVNHSHGRTKPDILRDASQLAAVQLSSRTL